MSVKRIHKKIFVISSIAIISLLGISTIISYSSIGSNKVFNCLVNNTIVVRNDDTLSQAIVPKTNDIYNDYSYKAGYVIVSNSNDALTFYNWYGQQLWNFNITTNSTTLFGSSGGTIQTLKIRSSSDSSLMYVYGTFSDNRSYLFAINVSNGSISKFGNKSAFVSDGSANGLIYNVNLLTLSDGYLLLFPKTPTVSGSNVSISFSEINPYIFTINPDYSYLALTNRNLDVSKSVSGISINSYGEIVMAEKAGAGTYYAFGIKCDVGNSSSHTPSLLIITLNLSVLGTSDDTQQATTFSNLSTSSSAVDLDNVIFNVQKVYDGQNNQKVVYSMKYSTSSLLVKPNYNATTIGSCYIDTNNNIKIETYNVSQSNSGAVGILNYFFDPSTNAAYVVLANSDISKIGILTLTDSSGNFVNNSTAKWIDLSSIDTSVGTDKIIDISFIPGTLDSSDNTYSGCIQIQQQNTTTRHFFTIDLNNSSITEQTPTYSWVNSDTAIYNKYNDSDYPVNANTESLIINDLCPVIVNGTQETATVTKNNLILDTNNNTILGTITLSFPSWGNSSQIFDTRSVNLKFNPSKTNSNNANLYPGSSSSGSGEDLNTPSMNSLMNNAASGSTVMKYSIVVVVVLVIIACFLGVAKIILGKKSIK